ncbi:homeobox-domain-containing protein [Backusella circina FSU 941]|nr:homeobox-domain-containing protein [Backusella circina FSU 941]
MSLPSTYNITESDLEFYSKNGLYNSDKKQFFSMAGGLPPPPPPPTAAAASTSGMTEDGAFDKDPPRKRTRTTPQQLAVLEKSFTLNPSPNNRTREQLAHQLGMSERSIQIWFQNRRAKVKNQAKRSMTHMRDSVLHMQQQYAANAAAAACQTIAFQQGQESIDSNLYYYYYYYYFHQQQQQQQQRANAAASSMPPPPPPSVANRGVTPTNSIPDLTVSASTSSSSITSDNRQRLHHHHEKRSQSVGPYPYYHRRTATPTPPYERPSSLGPSVNYHTPPPPPPMALYHQSVIMEEQQQQQQQQQRYLLTCQTLQIGSWKRVCDIQCQLDLGTRTLVWLVGDEQRGFKIEIGLDLIQFIRISGRYQISFFVNNPGFIQFYMGGSGEEWTQCHDFTQDKQASIQNLHVLEGTSQLVHDLNQVLVNAPDLKALVMDEEQLLEHYQQQNLLLLQSTTF